MLVVDASALVPLLVAEPGSVASRAVVAAGLDLLAPELILAETLNVLWKKQRLGQIEKRGLTPFLSRFSRVAWRVHARHALPQGKPGPTPFPASFFSFP